MGADKVIKGNENMSYLGLVLRGNKTNSLRNLRRRRQCAG